MRCVEKLCIERMCIERVCIERGCIERVRTCPMPHHNKPPLVVPFSGKGQQEVQPGDSDIWSIRTQGGHLRPTVTRSVIPVEGRERGVVEIGGLKVE